MPGISLARVFVELCDTELAIDKAREILFAVDTTALASECAQELHDIHYTLTVLTARIGCVKDTLR